MQLEKEVKLATSKLSTAESKIKSLNEELLQVQNALK